MNIPALESQLVIEVLVALIAIVPVAAGATIAYIQSKENQIAIKQLPTHDDVQQAIDNKVQELTQNNGVTAPKDGTK